MKKKIDIELAEMRKRLNDEEKYRACYLGGGDFLVHVMGIDPVIDRTVRAVETGEEPCERE
jgi:hypothetical protein